MSRATTQLLLGMSCAQLVMKAQDMQLEIEQLRAEVERLKADAKSWRQYQARKKAVIDAGMGRKILRDEAKGKS